MRISQKPNTAASIFFPVHSIAPVDAIQVHLGLLCFTDVVFFTNWGQGPPPAKHVQLAFLRYLRRRDGLETDPQHLWGVPVLQSKCNVFCLADMLRTNKNTILNMCGVLYFLKNFTLKHLLPFSHTSEAGEYTKGYLTVMKVSNCDRLFKNHPKANSWVPITLSTLIKIGTFLCEKWLVVKTTYNAYLIYYYSANLSLINDQTYPLKTHTHTFSHKHTQHGVWKP